MTAVDAGRTPAGVPSLSVPEIRDYEKLNAELVVLLDQGHGRVRLDGAEGQRLLGAGLRGGWNAVVEVEGRAGPELGFGLDAPGLTLVCRGSADDGAGSRMRAGRVVVGGDAGAGAGYAMTGGSLVVLGTAGPRAGLNQQGGVLLLRGEVGPLAFERQAGGLALAPAGRIGPHAGRAPRGGRRVALGTVGDPFAGLDFDSAAVLRSLLRELEPWPVDGPDGLSDLRGR